MLIEACTFGSMSIDGVAYGSDLMILPSGQIIESWRREKGHRLNIVDIQLLVDTKPGIIVVGTGIFGLMRPHHEVASHMAQYGIEWIALKTKPATQEFNRLKTSGANVAACFHLTC